MLVNHNILHLIVDKMALNKWKNKISKLNQEYASIFMNYEEGLGYQETFDTVLYEFKCKKCRLYYGGYLHNSSDKIAHLFICEHGCTQTYYDLPKNW